MEDGAIWLCIGIQLTLAGYDLPDWRPEYVMPGRDDIASCLLDGTCPAARDPLISSLTYDTLLQDNTDLSLPNTSTRDHSLSYAMLDPDYSYTLYDDCPRLSHVPEQVDILKNNYRQMKCRLSVYGYRISRQHSSYTRINFEEKLPRETFWTNFNHPHSQSG